MPKQATKIRLADTDAGAGFYLQLDAIKIAKCNLF